MREADKLILALMALLLVFVVPGYFVHASPRFAGSVAGGALGVGAAFFMLVILVYPLAKHIPAVSVRIQRAISLGALLRFHIYGGVIGALLGIIHSGHKYESPIGIALVLSMLLTVLSGFVGRYYLAHVSADLGHQQESLAKMRAAYNLAAGALAGDGKPSRSFASLGVSVLPLVEGIADLEHAILAKDWMRRMLNLWIIVHVLAALVFYALLALHIWSGFYYGLRWLG